MSAVSRAHAYRFEPVGFTAAVSMPFHRQLISSNSLDNLMAACAIWRTRRSVPERAATCAQALHSTSFYLSETLTDPVCIFTQNDWTYTVAPESSFGAP